MKNKHNFVCINCPLSCPLELIEEDGEIIEVSGNECKVGAKYAEEEFRDPRRMVTTTVKVKAGTLSLLPVVSTSPIPKKLVKEAVMVLSDVVVDAPVEDKQVIYSDILGTGVDIVSSRRLEKVSGQSG
jgi:CxxC motif-containing protein